MYFGDERKIHENVCKHIWATLPIIIIGIGPIRQSTTPTRTIRATIEQCHHFGKGIAGSLVLLMRLNAISDTRRELGLRELLLFQGEHAVN